MHFTRTLSKNTRTNVGWPARHAASILIVLLFCASALADNKGDHLNPGGTLFGDSTDFLQSADGRYRLIMQADCNLVLYKNRFVFWASGTNRKGTHCRATMQGDGNFVVYAGNAPLWASNTEHHSGAFVIQQNDGNVVVYQGHTPLWASNTRVPEPAARPVNGHPTFLDPGESLEGARNDFLQATGTSITFRMQPDCNLVLYEDHAPRWASNTQGKGGDCKAIMQTDGNLVIYNDGGWPVWASGSNGKNGASLLLQQDRNAVIYFGNNRQAVWATHTEYPRRVRASAPGANLGPFPGCVPVRTDHDCYVLVMVCKDIYACPGLTSNLVRPEKADTPYVCGVCGIKGSF